MVNKSDSNVRSVKMKRNPHLLKIPSSNMDGGIRGLLLLLFLHAGGALELNVPSSYRVGVGSETCIPCTFTVDKPPVDPKYFAVFWSFKGNEILSYNDFVKTSDPRFSLNTENSLNGDASLSISRVKISDEGVYTCSILYSPERKEKEVALHVQAPPEITITRSIVIMNQQSILRAEITGFYPVDINVKWLKDGKMLDGVSVSRPQRNPDDTYSMNSTVNIKPTEEDKHRTFSCRVQHKFLSEPQNKDFQLEFAVSPEINITRRLVVLNQESVLSCSITGFYPADINVKWSKDGKMLDRVSVSRPQRNPEGTYSVTSTVTIKPTEEDKHRTFSCRVQHESLSGPLHTDFQLEFADEDRTSTIVISVIVVAVVVSVVLAILTAIYFWNKKRKKGMRGQDENKEASPLMGSCIKVGEIEILSQSNQEISLQCTISKVNCKRLNVEWFKVEKGSRRPDQLLCSEKCRIDDPKCEGGLCTTRLTYFTSPNEVAHFLCRVTHPSLKKLIERRITPPISEGRTTGTDKRTEEITERTVQQRINEVEERDKANEAGFISPAKQTVNQTSVQNAKQKNTRGPPIFSNPELRQEKVTRGKRAEKEDMELKSTSQKPSTPASHNTERGHKTPNTSSGQKMRQDRPSDEQAKSGQKPIGGTEEPAEAPKQGFTKAATKTAAKPSKGEEVEEEQTQRNTLEEEKAETSSESTRYVHRAPGTQNEDPFIGTSLEEQQKESDICKEEEVDPQRGTTPKHIHGEPRAKTEADPPETKTGEKEQIEKKPQKKEKAQVHRHVHRAPGTQNEEDPSIRESLEEQQKESDICKEEGADPQRGTPAECPKHVHGEPRAETEGDPPETKAGEKEQREKKSLKKENVETGTEKPPEDPQ